MNNKSKKDIRKGIDKEQRPLEHFIPPREQSPNLIDLEEEAIVILSIEFADFTQRDGSSGKFARVTLEDKDEPHVTFSKVVVEQLERIAPELDKYYCLCTIARVKNYHTLKQYEGE